MSIILLYFTLGYFTSCATSEYILCSETANCPFSQQCFNNCYKCLSKSSACFNLSSIQFCTLNAKTCRKSYLTAESGSHSQKINENMICYWILDLRKFSESTWTMELFYESLPAVYILSFPFTNNESNKSLLMDKGNFNIISSQKQVLKGNYFIVGCWSGDYSSNFKFSWKLSQSNTEYKIITSLLIFTVLLSILIIKIGNHFKPPKRLNFLTLKNSEEIGETAKDFYIPIQYYLIDVKETCPLCYGYFSYGQEIRKAMCSHYYHIECLDEWFETRKSFKCLLCKKELIILS